MHPLPPKLVLSLLGLALTACGAARPAAFRDPVLRAAAVASLPAARWFRPTPPPAVDTATQLTNVSNLPGYDRAPSVAMHPADGWAAIIWANVLPESDDANVYVRVQDPGSGTWQPGRGVNTAPATQYAAHPTLAIDASGRIHALFAQDGDRLHYSRSTDFGRTWTTPEPVAAPTASGDGMALRAAVDGAGMLHVVYIAGDCGFECFSTWHIERAADAVPGARWSTPERPLPGTKHLRADLVTLGNRVVVAAACPVGCGPSRPVVAIREGNGAWRERRIGGNVTHAGWEINWISAVTAGENRVCVAWGHYARSGNYSSCSFDRGERWEDAKPIIETYPPRYDGDSGTTPVLLYEPLSDALMAIQIYAQAGGGDRQTVYPVFSIRRLAEDHWVPDVAGSFGHANRSVPFRLFAAETKWSAAFAREGLRVAYAGHDLALAVWVENAQTESMDVYSGWFHPAAFLAEINDMADRRRRLLWTAYAIVQVAVMMSCAPYLSNTHPEIRSLPFAWQCPTATPVPTVLLGYEPAPPAYPAPPPPTEGYPAPPAERIPIYSTPVPTATPYIRTGADFFERQRVAIGPLIVAAERAGRNIRVTLQNRTAAPVEVHMTVSVVRTVRADDGRLIEGSWSPSNDGPGVIAARSTETVELTFPTLPGEPQEWGMPFINDEQRRSGSSGNGYAWWGFRPDPYCGGQAGGPPSDSYGLPQPVAAPAVARAGWPVPEGTVISRGYGCHAYWTGVRGAGCPASQPWWHNGIDFANDLGTPIYAVADMTIQGAGSVGDCAGNFIRGQDAEGSTYDFYHLQVFASGVRAGAQVAAGQVIAQMGSTGCSTGAHLHLTARAPDGREINPFNLLQP